MQQTEKYQFNLIEKTDVFSPDALNATTQKVEDEFEAVRAEAAALEQRVSVLEVHKVVAGIHEGNGTVELGFTPIAVFAIGSNGNGFVVQDRDESGLKIVEGGFAHGGYFANCRYVAFV